MVNWNILQPVDIGGAFQSGLESGRQEIAQRETRNALASLVQNPNDPNAINALAKYDPMTAMQFQQRGQQAQAQQREVDVKTRAAQGDPQAIAELAGIDWNAWESLRPDEKGKIKDQNNYIGQSALAISQLPPEQRAAAWDAYIDQGVQMGYTTLGQFRGQYSDQALQAAIANAGLVENLWEAEEVKYTVLPQGATMVPVSQRTGIPLATEGQGFSTTPPQQQRPTPDAEDIQMLKDNPSAAAQFDEVFGQGAAQRVLQGGQTPQASGNFQ